jgi:hypothetical protein
MSGEAAKRTGGRVARFRFWLSGLRSRGLRGRHDGRSGFAISIGVIGICCIVVGVLVLLIGGNLYAVPSPTIWLGTIGAFLVVLGLLEDALIVEKKKAKD